MSDAAPVRQRTTRVVAKGKGAYGNVIAWGRSGLVLTGLREPGAGSNPDASKTRTDSG